MEVYNFRRINYPIVLKLPFFKKEIVYFVKTRYSSLEDIFKNVLKNDFSFFICIEGRPRSGKSTLAYWLTWYFLKYKKQNAEPKEVLKRFYFVLPKKEVLKRKEIFVFNEAIIEIYKRTAMTQKNIFWIRYFTILQRMNNIYVFVLPSYKLLDVDIRKEFLDMRFSILKRGFCEVWIKRKTKKRVYWHKVAEFSFPDLPKEWKVEFEKVDREGKEKYVESLTTKKEEIDETFLQEMERLRKIEKFEFI